MAEPCRSQGFALFGKIKCECVALNYSSFIIHSSLFSALSALNSKKADDRSHPLLYSNFN